MKSTLLHNGRWSAAVMVPEGGAARETRSRAALASFRSRAAVTRDLREGRP